jgi:hypothetical protein
MAANARFHGIGNWNHFLDWAYKSGCVLKAEDKGKKEETHLLLNGAIGGRLSVPDAKYDEFLRAMEMAAIRDDAWLYVVERQTRPAFKMLVELDIELWDHALTLQEIMEQVLPPFVRVMDAAYPDQHPRIIVCTADPKELEHDATGRVLVKSGIHLIWPEIAVNAQIAWNLRAWFLYELSLCVQPFVPVKGWDAAIDPCVFEKNGLRMIWSRKTKPCPECKGRSRQLLIEERKQRKMRLDGGVSARGKVQIIKRLDIQACDTCQNEGKIDLGRPYNAVAVLSSRGGNEDVYDFETLKRDTFSILRITSIKIIPRLTDDQIPVIALARNVKVLIDPFARRPTKAAVKACTDGIKDLIKPPVGFRKRAASGNLPPSTALNSVMGDDPVYAVIMAYAEKCLTGGRITSIKTDLDRHMYLLNSTCNMCLNKGSNHSSSTVYYLMYPDGIVQKCRSNPTNLPIYYHDCKRVTPETRPDLFRPGTMLPPQTCKEFRSSMIHYPIGEAAKIAKIFPFRYASKFAMAPVPRPPSIDADMGTSQSQRSLGEDSSLGSLDAGGDNSHLGKLTLLDYNPTLRDAPSFAEARRKYVAGKQALSGKSVDPPPDQK